MRTWRPDRIAYDGMQKAFDDYIDFFPTLLWGEPSRIKIDGYEDANDGWWWHQPLRERMEAELRYVVYWGA